MINVLHGDMSLVGPRPATERRQTPGEEQSADFRPGITGLWVLHPRADITAQDAAMLDRNYVNSWSLSGDIRIPTRTAAAVRYGAETALNIQ